MAVDADGQAVMVVLSKLWVKIKGEKIKQTYIVVWVVAIYVRSGGGDGQRDGCKGEKKWKLLTRYGNRWRGGVVVRDREREREILYVFVYRNKQCDAW